MSERSNNFDLKLLTSSKEVGLRRLRSYAASLGGGAQIYNTFEDIRRNLESSFNGRRAHIVMHDDTIPLSAAQVSELQRFARVFMVKRPDAQKNLVVPARTAACWQAEAFLQCSLGVLLDSPVIRMSMAQMCKPTQPFMLEHLLRWGHASSTWRAGNPGQGVADAALRFIRELNLVGEGRRLTEMFSHFIQARLPLLHLKPEAVTFGADGLLITVIARCRLEAGAQASDIGAAAQELRIHDFPIAVTNNLGNGLYEIAALHYPFQAPIVGDERILMAFNKSPEIAAVADVADDATGAGAASAAKTVDDAFPVRSIPKAG